MLKWLPADEIEVCVYSPGRASSEVFREAGAPVVEGPVSAFTHFSYFVYRGRDWVFFLRELLLLPLHVAWFGYSLVRCPCDIVHLNEGNLLATAVVAKAFGKKVVCHLRSALPSDDRGLRMSFIRWVYRRFCDRIVTIESATLAPIADLPHAVVISNPVEIDTFASATPGRFRETMGIAPDEICVAAVGRASPDEGLLELIEAAELLRDQEPRIRFVWVGAAGTPTSAARPRMFRWARKLGLGTGQYDSVARDLVRARGLEGTFLLAPYQANVWSVYKEVDIVVTGGAAGLGRQVHEAGAAGRPVVGLSSLPRPDLIEDGHNGHVVPLGDAGALAARLRTLALDPALRARLGSAGLERARERADPRRVADRMLRLYRDVLGQSGLAEDAAHA
jgi:glycosyltransferase involved in cell wall biosynthesis